VIKCDGDKEYNSKTFNAFHKENGIVKLTTTPYTPKQNGVVEKKNQTFIESV
jgi:transposase InsO family protein